MIWHNIATYIDIMICILKGIRWYIGLTILSTYSLCTSINNIYETEPLFIGLVYICPYSMASHTIIFVQCMNNLHILYRKQQFLYNNVSLLCKLQQIMGLMLCGVPGLFLQQMYCLICSKENVDHCGSQKALV